MSSLYKNYDLNSLPYFELGYIIVFLTFIQIVLIALILIILPLFQLGWQGEDKLWTIFYFSGIGLGYMFMEIMFIHKFILYLGSPIYSATAVISSMLICSGVGSYYHDRIKMLTRYKWLIFALIIMIMVTYFFFIDSLFQTTISYSSTVKFFISFIIIAPVSFVMGIPFPKGIHYLSKSQNDIIAWALGINGCFSIIGAVSATIISVEFGHQAVLLTALLAYSIPLISNILRSKTKIHDLMNS